MRRDDDEVSADRPHLLRRDGDAMSRRRHDLRRAALRAGGASSRRAPRVVAQRRRAGRVPSCPVSRRARSPSSYRLGAEPAVGVPLTISDHGARRRRGRRAQHLSATRRRRDAVLMTPTRCPPAERTVPSGGRSTVVPLAADAGYLNVIVAGRDRRRRAGAQPLDHAAQRGAEAARARRRRPTARR